MTDHDDHEQLADGVGSVLAGDGDDAPGRRVRIVPIGEGDITRGESGDIKRWGREALQAAAADGTLNGALIVKGTGGENPHFPLDEQVPPENILGRVDDWEYEEGTGPVGHADLADEDIADRVELGLLDVSADIFHDVADPEADVLDVSEIVAMPRVTILEYGASHSASIEADTAAALGLDPDEYASQQSPGDGDGDGDGDADVAGDDAGAGVEQNALRRWLKRGRELLTPPDDVDSAGAALAGANAEGLAAAAQASGEFDETTQNNIETTGAATDSSDTPSDTPVDQPNPTFDTDPMTDDDPLQEQLAEARERIASLESDLSEKDDEIEQLQADLDDKDDEIDQLRSAKEDAEGDLEQLREEIQPWQEMLAEIATGGSMLAPEHVAASQSFEQLSERVLQEFADEDDDASPMDRLQAQLSDTVRARGDGPSDPETDRLTDEQRAQADSLAQSVMNVDDLKQAETEGLAPREYVRQRYDIDPVAADSEAELRRKKATANGGD
jgi:predicted  nucleic acid-binding Zn-ribbon protein